ncbi:4-diphosphocytidyl-2-C-methyl-D-erythritol kinase [Kordiimonas sediminis]|uniref:4-diphosphocytidyl-2-C-methyl-D-erythritol kinase n=1 Tax=Kordiimonas sediminis TaxID=1735581 RepID=A0A919ATM5_9PROT|nr:4-(cytidine 5'-diphospho)-2-C-methyl-D-erythritol kinase [Kordiimonas sediminis]GHF23582.1 4-diphosphocytidyl-2-C-methyl-D-erythritol kinase [Kordiimonas sediminis]
MSDAVTIDAPAKINLFLHITGRRSNGYHDLESLFVFTHAGDGITCELADTFSLAITGPFAPDLEGTDLEGTAPEDNLCLKAARLLASRVSVSGQGVRITLDKKLPIAAGIGGGSSDAAATLLALNSLWNCGLSHDELAAMSLELGADVPACLYQQALWVKGIGEDVSPVTHSLPPYILLVNPGVKVETPSVFKRFQTLEEPFVADISPDQRSDILHDTEHLFRETVNSLQAPAVSLCPVIQDVVAALSETAGCLGARMSGSGATCFALYEDETALACAEKDMKTKHPNWWVYADRLRN